MTFIFLSFLYHNETSYTYFEEKINPKLIPVFNLDPLKGLNNQLHKVDIVGKIKGMNSPLSENDYIDIKIDEQQQAKLLSGIQFHPVKKKWVKIDLTIDGKTQKAKLKLHGTNIRHYIGDKFSYSLKLKSDSEYIHNSRRFKLIKGEEVDPPIIAVNNLAHSIGLISAYGQMKIVRLNGEEKGDYCFVEDIEKEFLEREFGITNYAIITNTNDRTKKEFFHASNKDFFFQHIAKNKDSLQPQALNQYKIFTELIEKKDLNGIKKMIDIEYMAKFLALASLFNDNHFLTGDNLKWVYDFSRGKFFPIYRAEFSGQPIRTGYSSFFQHYNKFLFASNGPRYYNSCPTSRFYKLLLSDNTIRNLRDRSTYSLLKNNDFLQKIVKTHEENERIMLHSGRSRREYDRSKVKQITHVEKMVDIARNYINYTHIYGSYDRDKKEVHLLIDAFVPINISYKKSVFKRTNLIGINFNRKLTPKHRYYTFHIDDENFSLKKMVFINSITKDTIKEHKHFNTINTSDSPAQRTTLQMLQDNHIQYSLSGNKLTIKPNTYSITSSILISSNYTTVFPAGLTLKLGKGINCMIKGNISIEGTEEKNVSITNLEERKHFGCFSIIGEKRASIAKINFLRVSGGSESNYQGHLFTGQFAVYYSNITITNSCFENSKGDDGLNIKYSKVKIENCYLKNNFADQIDLDFCYAIINRSHFSRSIKDSNGDGLDLSGSYAQISNCSFNYFQDKGVSLGERSKVLVNNCLFKNNKNGIVVKDGTRLYAWKNHFTSNQNDYASYIKKQIFKDPQLFLQDNCKNLKMKLEKKESLHKFTSKNLEIQKREFEKSFSNYTATTSLSGKPVF